MTSRTRVLDRILVFLTGAALVAVGVTALLWSRGVLLAGRPLQFSAPVDDPGAWWWTPAAAGLGLLLAAAGLWWLSVHRRAPAARRIILPPDGAGGTGRLSADVAAVASAAADALELEPGVVKATSRSSIEKGVPTITLTVAVPARHGLRSAVEAVDGVVATAAAMLGDSVAFRTRIRVDTHRRHSPVA